MPEGQLSALVNPTHSETVKSVRPFVRDQTDGVRRTKHSETIVEYSGPTFNSELEDNVDEFVKSLRDVEFARFSFNDEYGTEIFWIINNGKVVKSVHDPEEPSKGLVKAYRAMHKGLGWVRTGVLDESEIAEINRELKDTRKEAYLDVVFLPPISIDLNYHEFSDGYTAPRNSTTKSDYTFAYWMPISRDKGKSVDGLIDQLLELTGQDFYAKIYNDMILEQQVVHCTTEGIEVLLDISEYTLDELEYVNQQTDQSQGEFEWDSFNIMKINRFLGEVSLQDQVHDRVTAYRDGIANEALRVEKLLADNPDGREPLLEGLGFIVYYKQTDEQQANKIADELLVLGMQKDLVESGLTSDGANVLNVTTRLEPAGQWLIDNLPALSDHKTVIDNRDGPFDDENADDVNYIIISMT